MLLGIPPKEGALDHGLNYLIDANMAKEMTGYVRSSILAQTAQSMLAQANQNAGAVLSLLGGQ